ncbi:MAG: hypothetical protein GXP63_04320 [DPANN group archaeon]|nr:hypothetical protein [DPANN group archaeon]
MVPLFDIVVPDGNEEGLIRMAERLGYTGLVFLVAQQKLLGAEQARLALLQEHTSLSLRPGLLLSGREMRGQRRDLTIVSRPQDPRLVIEQRGADFLLGVELLERRDRMHHRSSGLNQVLAKLAREKEVGLAFSFNAVLDAPDEVFSLLMGRMRQNIRLASKYGVAVRIGSLASSPLEMRNPLDLRAFYGLLGMTTEMLRAAFDW